MDEVMEAPIDDLEALFTEDDELELLGAAPPAKGTDKNV